MRIFSKTLQFSRRSFLLTSAASCASLTAFSAKALESDFYKPRFFTTEEMEFLEAAAELIYPEDEHGPGAKSLKVARYIDTQMLLPYGFGARTYTSGPFVEGPSNLGYQLSYTPRELYKKSIAAVDRWVREKTKETYIERFKDLDKQKQIEVLSNLQDGNIQLEDISSSIFFSVLRSNVLEGVFSDPFYGGNAQMQGWKFIGFPGARADFMEFINQQGAPYPYGSTGISLTLDQMQNFWKTSEDAQR